MDLFKLNGVPVPLPQRGIDVNLVPMVETMQNANGETVGQKIGRDRYEIDGLVWPYLEAEVWKNILELVKEPLVDVTFQDPQTGSPVTVKMLCKEKPGKAFKINNNQQVTHYIDCSIMLEDTGE